jgi:hypothetical protein
VYIYICTQYIDYIEIHMWYPGFHIKIAGVHGCSFPRSFAKSQDLTCFNHPCMIHILQAEALSTHTPDINDKGGTGVPGLVHFA